MPRLQREGGDSQNPEIEIQNFLPDLLEEPWRVTNVTLIFHIGRSGSWLLHSLLDNHPEILTVPPQAIVLHQAKFWGELVSSSLDAREMAEQIADQYPALFRQLVYNGQLEKSVLYGVNKDEVAGVEREVFVEHLSTCIQRCELRDGLNYSNILAAIHVAYAAASGRIIKTISPTIVWSIHSPANEEQRRILCNDFPGSRHLLSIRHPVKTLDSHFYWSMIPFSVPDVSASRARNRRIRKEIFGFFNHSSFAKISDLAKNFAVSLHSVRPPTNAELPTVVFTHASSTGSSYNPAEGNLEAAVRFEDIHSDPRSTMSALAHWLGIEWHDNLLQSTVNGKMFWFPARAGHITGTNPKAGEDRKPVLLGRIDTLVIERIFRPNYDAWSYEIDQKYLPKLLRKNFAIKLLVLFPMLIELRVLSDTLRASIKMYKIHGRETILFWEVLITSARFLVERARIVAWCYRELRLNARGRKVIPLLQRVFDETDSIQSQKSEYS